jgi:hypothetical protein
MSMSEETGDYSSLFYDTYPSVDPKIFNNKLTIEEPLSENAERDIYATVDVSLKHQVRKDKLAKKQVRSQFEPLYEDIRVDPLSNSESNIYEKIVSRLNNL